MALQKEFNTPYGIQADAGYWKIVETNIDWHTRGSGVTMFGYYSKEARDTGCQPIESRFFNFNGDDFIFSVDSNIVQDAYSKIKTLPEFSNAIDC